MGLGYFLVGAAPTYVLILGALMVASIAGSIWHPTARGLLSQIYPHRRGFMITVDRSAGALGDSSGPLIASWLLAYLLWQEVFLPALPLALLFMFFLWVLLRRSQAFQAVGARSKTQSRPLSEQLRALMGLFRENSRILSLLILIKAIAGFAQGGLFVWLPFYLRDVAGMSELGYGFHLSLLTAMGIVTGPGFGYLSDRIGRMPVIVIVLAAKTAIAALIAFSGTGLVLTLLIAAMGTVNLVVNPLVQTWALDIAHGRNLEGSTLGVLDGANAIFRGAGPLMTGIVVTIWGTESVFWYMAAMSAAALVVVLFTLPFTGRGSRMM
jgi:MFS family permease